VGTIKEWLSSTSTEIRILASDLKNMLSAFAKMLSEKIRDQKNSQMKKLYEIKNNWHKSSENTNNSFEKQKPILQKAQETILNNLIMELIRDYSKLSLNYQKELEKTNQLQYDHYNTIRKKDFEISRLKIELARSTSDLRAESLALELADWNIQIKRLQSKVESLEAQLSQSRFKSEEEGQLLEKLQKKEHNTIVGEDGIIISNENKMCNELDVKNKSTPQRQHESTYEDRQDLREEFMNAIREIGLEQKRASHKNNKNSSNGNNLSNNIEK
jgi:hypothetical protein